MKKIFILGFVIYISLLAFPIAAQKEAKPASIKKLLELTNANDMAVQVMNQMIPILKQMIPNAPEEFWADILAEIDIDGMVDMIIPIYQKYFTEKDISAINRFYRSPVGKKLIENQPAILQESIQAGQLWGQNRAEEVITRYRQESQSDE